MQRRDDNAKDLMLPPAGCREGSGHLELSVSDRDGGNNSSKCEQVDKEGVSNH